MHTSFDGASLVRRVYMRTSEKSKEHLLYIYSLLYIYYLGFFLLITG
jgi:hypothetical protein